MLVKKVPTISQGSVATRLRRGGIFNSRLLKFTAESDNEIIVKIDQRLAKLRPRI